VVHTDPQADTVLWRSADHGGFARWRIGDWPGETADEQQAADGAMGRPPVAPRRPTRRARNMFSKNVRPRGSWKSAAGGLRELPPSRLDHFFTIKTILCLIYNNRGAGGVCFIFAVFSSLPIFEAAETLNEYWSLSSLWQQYGKYCLNLDPI